MKTVFSNPMVAHVWAQQTQSEGRGSSFFFKEDIIYSYGHHFVVGFIDDKKKHQGQQVVLLNSRSYSPSTAKHQSYARRAVDHFHRVYLPDLDVSGYKDHYIINHFKICRAFAATFQSEYHRLAKARKNLSIQDETNFEAYSDIYAKELKKVKEYKDAVKLLAKCRTLATPEKRAEAVRKEKEREAKQQAEYKKSYNKVISFWLRGLPLPDDHRGDADKARKYNAGHELLRLHHDTVQTTKGANVALHVALPALQAYLKHPEKVQGLQIAHFTVTKSDKEAVCIGCHRILHTTIKDFIGTLQQKGVMA